MGRAWWSGLMAACLGLGADGPAAPTRTESIARGDGGTIAGRVVGDPRSGFRFEPTPGQPSNPARLTLQAAGTISFDGPIADPSVFPPIRVELGGDERISGRLARSDDSTIHLEDGPGGRQVAIVRAGAAGLAQRPGEAVVIRDGFERLDLSRWVMSGEPEIVENPHIEGNRALRLPAEGAAITATLAEPVASGRLEVAFHDPGTKATGNQWFVDLFFRGEEGPESVQVLLDAGEESLGLQSRNGSALAVQRLARQPGWHRLAVRFGPETELSVDANVLAHGRGPGGPLVEIRLAHRLIGSGPDQPPATEMAIGFDDLRLVRLAEPIGGLEIAPRIDDVRLIGGDQIFGQFRSADADLVRLEVDGREIALAWTEVASIQFRRDPIQGRPIDGLLVRVEWRPGSDPRDLDAAEGALLALTDTTLTLVTPYAGDLAIPRDRLQRLKVVGQGTRLVVDPHAHHLGDDISVLPPVLDPPYPEGGTLERTFTLESIPDATRNPASVVFDVVQVVGAETGDPSYSPLVRKGELRTNIRVNGQLVDYLNRHITTRNETPERVRLNLPPGLLHAGINTIRVEQVGLKDDPNEFDEIGILSIAIEFAPNPR